MKRIIPALIAVAALALPSAAMANTPVSMNGNVGDQLHATVLEPTVGSSPGFPEAISYMQWTDGTSIWQPSNDPGTGITVDPASTCAVGVSGPCTIIFDASSGVEGTFGAGVSLIVVWHNPNNPVQPSVSYDVTATFSQPLTLPPPLAFTATSLSGRVDYSSGSAAVYSYTLNQAASEVVTITHKRSNGTCASSVVRSWNLTGTSKSVSWKGKNTAGNKVAIGSYCISTLANGTLASSTRTVRVTA